MSVHTAFRPFFTQRGPATWPNLVVKYIYTDSNRTRFIYDGTKT